MKSDPTRLLLATVFTGALVAAALPAAGQVACGDTIGPGERVVLTGDLGPCPGPEPALTLVGPATLDLGGATVLCVGMPGIRIEGRRARLRGGVVRSCSPAVVVAGEGRHRIDDVLTSGGGDSVHVESDRNRLTRVGSSNSDGERGLLVTGDGNRLVAISAIDGGLGLDVQGSRSRIEDARVADNTGAGIVLGGNGNRMRGGVVSFNSEGGVVVSGDANRVERIFVTESGVFDDLHPGISITGDANRILSNESYSGFGEGIRVGPGARGNLLKRNVSMGHFVAPDLVDANGQACNGNRWLANLFSTSDPAKGAGPACIE